MLGRLPSVVDIRDESDRLRGQAGGAAMKVVKLQQPPAGDFCCGGGVPFGPEQSRADFKQFEPLPDDGGSLIFILFRFIRHFDLLVGA